MRPSDLPFDSRVLCPCCGYPTLTEPAAYEICELCNWEDDGQGEADAAVVRGGPNGEYSLSEARANFRRYLLMYRPDNDTRATGPDSPLELAAKQALIGAFDRLRAEAEPAERATLLSRIHEQEAILEAELHRAVREYEAKHRADGSA